MQNPSHDEPESSTRNRGIRLKDSWLRWELTDRYGTVVGQLTRSLAAQLHMPCAFVTVTAAVTWDRGRSKPEYRDAPASDAWEVE